MPLAKLRVIGQKILVKGIKPVTKADCCCYCRFLVHDTLDGTFMGIEDFPDNSHNVIIDGTEYLEPGSYDAIDFLNDTHRMTWDEDHPAWDGTLGSWRKEVGSSLLTLPGSGVSKTVNWVAQTTCEVVDGASVFVPTIWSPDLRPDLGVATAPWSYAFFSFGAIGATVDNLFTGAASDPVGDGNCKLVKP